VGITGENATKHGLRTVSHSHTHTHTHSLSLMLCAVCCVCVFALGVSGW
jgi:hypothetical protein